MNQFKSLQHLTILAVNSITSQLLNDKISLSSAGNKLDRVFKDYNNSGLMEFQEKEGLESANELHNSFTKISNDNKMSDNSREYAKDALKHVTKGVWCIENKYTDEPETLDKKNTLNKLLELSSFLVRDQLEDW